MHDYDQASANILGLTACGEQPHEIFTIYAGQIHILWVKIQLGTSC